MDGSFRVGERACASGRGHASVLQTQLSSKLLHRAGQRVRGRPHVLKVVRADVLRLRPAHSESNLVACQRGGVPDRRHR